MSVDLTRESWFAFALVAGTGLVLGLVGRRLQLVRQGLVFLALVSAVVPFVYYVMEGHASQCTGAGATLRCTEASYASAWGLYGWILVGTVILLTLAPVASALRRSALPSVLVAIVLTLLFAANAPFLWPWVAAWAAVLAAAIAGPPSDDRRAVAPKT